MFKTKTMSIKLKRLKIKNFKCFLEEKTFDFSKLTILTGGNSSGKSSILHAILGAVQSGEFPYNFSPNGKYVNMGDFKEISNKHLSKDIKLEFTFKHMKLKSEYVFNTIWRNNKANSLPELKSLDLKSADTNMILKKKVGRSYSLTFSYDPEKDSDYDQAKQMELKEEMIKSFMNSQTLNSGKKQKDFERELKRQKLYIETMFKKITINFIVKDLENIQEEAKNHNNINLNYTLDGLVRIMWWKYSDVINAISSFRHHPDRTYLEQSKDKLKVDKSGDGYLDQIILWEKRKSPKFKELQNIMKDDLKLLDSMSTNRMMGGGRYEVLVKTKDAGTETSLFDVGYGISQFLPVIVADLQLPEGSTLFVAEPEIHLHPNVQAAFGD